MKRRPTAGDSVGRPRRTKMLMVVHVYVTRRTYEFGSSACANRTSSGQRRRLRCGVDVTIIRCTCLIETRVNTEWIDASKQRRGARTRLCPLVSLRRLSKQKWSQLRPLGLHLTALGEVRPFDMPAHVNTSTDAYRPYSVNAFTYGFTCTSMHAMGVKVRCTGALSYGRQRQPCDKVESNRETYSRNQQLHLFASMKSIRVRLLEVTTVQTI